MQSVSYTTQPVAGTNNVDLMDTTGNGVTFDQQPNFRGLVNEKNEPRYVIEMTFYPSVVVSPGSVTVNPIPGGNVKEFSVELLPVSAPDQANPIVSVTSHLDNNNKPLIDSFGNTQLPSPLGRLRFIVLETFDSL